MGYGKRPPGDAGSGRHTGRAGWLGGRHRRRGCAGSVVVFGGAVLAVGLAIKEVVS